MKALRESYQFVTHLRRAKNLNGFRSMVVQRCEQNLLLTRQQVACGPRVLRRHFATGLGGGRESGVEVKEKIQGVEEERNEVKKKIEGIEALSWDKLSAAKQMALQDEVGFEKWKMAEKKSLQDILKGLQDEKNILLKQAGPVANVERPSFFTLKNSGEEETVQQAWELYLEGKPKVDTEGQAWLQAISSAKVVTHDELKLVVGEEQVDGLMQTKVEVHNLSGEKTSWPLMTEGEIGVTKISWDIGDTEVEYEEEVERPSDAKEIMADSLHVVTLPKPILGPPDNSVSRQVLFFRNLDVALMKVCEKEQRNVLIGSPGISKSWHLWKMLVCYANHDLLKIFRPDVKEESKPRAVAFVDKMTRTFFFSGKENWQEAAVHFSTTDNMWHLARGTCMLPDALTLYDRKGAIVPDELYGIPFLASFSPDASRYKEYVKQMHAAMHYVACPTKFEIAAMVSCLEQYGGLGKCANTAEAMRRVDELGPFLRPITQYSASEFSREVLLRNELIDKTIPRTVEATLVNRITLEKENSDPLSHRLARFHTPFAKDGDFLKTVLRYASVGARLALKEHCKKVKLEDLQREMVRYEHLAKIPSNDAGEAKTTHEQLIQRYISSVPCKWDIVQSKRGKQGSPKILGPMSFNNENFDYAKVDAAHMKKGILYVPWDPTYPFVDMLFVENDGGLVNKDCRVVYAVQVTRQKNHPKEAKTFWGFYRKLGLKTKEEKGGDFESDKLIVLMAVKRKDVVTYVEGSQSVYWKGVPPENEDEVVEFRVMVTHAAYLPEETKYEVLLEELEEKKKGN